MLVMLLEFAAVGRFHRGFQLPFVKGTLKAWGVETHWVRFAVDADLRARHDEDGTSLEDADISRLRSLVRDLRCSHVLCSRLPSSRVLGAIREAGPSVRVGHLEDATPGASDPALQGSEPVCFTPGALSAFVEIPVRGLDDSASLIEVETPDFGWEPANSAAVQEPPLPFLLCGPECSYRKSVRSHPCFAELDLSGCQRTDGCAFCVRPRQDPSRKVDSVALFERQLEALRRTHRAWEGRLAVRAVGEPILGNIEDVVRILCDSSIAPVDLLLDGRADRIVAAEAALRRALARLDGSAHVLHLCLVGIESFVDEELALLNKGTTSEDNFRLAELLFALENDFPASFAFRSHGGLSLLLFTPWTRPQNLSLNLAILKRTRLAEFCGKLFTSRLRLYPSLPLYALAHRDGLLLDRYADPRLDTARHNLYDDEVPWKFADPSMDAVCSLLIRLGDVLEATADTLADSLRALLPSDPGTNDLLDLAESVVDEALIHPPMSAEALLAAVGKAREVSANTTTSISIPELESIPTSLVALSAGLKPVVRLEGNDVMSRGWDDAILKSYGKVVRRRQPAEAGSPAEVFVGLEEDVVERALSLTDRLERQQDDPAWQQAAEEVGVLLGYPGCCARAFAQRLPSVKDSDVWLHVESRIEQPGMVAKELNPGGDYVVNYVPCSLECKATAALASRVLDELRQQWSPEKLERLERASRHPWILFPDCQGDVVEIVTDREPVGQFPYRAGCARGRHPLVARVVEGDTLDVGPQHLLVLREGRVIASMGARAFVWWYGAPVQANFWRHMLALRLRPRRAKAPGEGPIGPAAQQLATLLGRWLGLTSARPLDLVGFRVLSVTPHREDQVRIEMRCGAVGFALVAAPWADGAGAYARAGPLAIFHPRDVKMDSRRKQLATQKLVLLIDRGFRERAKIRGL